LARAFDGTR
jgi:hypothetical protein